MHQYQTAQHNCETAKQEERKLLQQLRDTLDAYEQDNSLEAEPFQRQLLKAENLLRELKETNERRIKFEKILTGNCLDY